MHGKAVLIAAGEVQAIPATDGVFRLMRALFYRHSLRRERVHGDIDELLHPLVAEVPLGIVAEVRSTLPSW